MTEQPQDGGRVGPAPGADPAFLSFLADRLAEDSAAGEGRGSDLSVLGEVLAAVRRGEAPDRMSLGLLTVAYSRHPDFREEWNRWRPTGGSANKEEAFPRRCGVRRWKIRDDGRSGSGYSLPSEKSTSNESNKCGS